MMGRHSQRGATLVIALVMLVLLTLFAVSALNTGTANLKVTGNMQARTEALNAAQETIETVISTPIFTTTPANAIVNACGAANTLCMDGAGNTVTSPANAVYITTLTPQPACVSVRGIKNSELNLADSKDVQCLAGQSQQHGVSGAVTGDSLCANSVWDVTAQTNATSGGATSTVVQGVAIRISTDDMATSCL